MLELLLSEAADAELKRLERSPSEAGKTKQIKKALGYLQKNPKHPSLQTHKFHSVPHPYDPNQDVFVAYAQQHTPGAARILWCYGKDRGQLTILAIIAHP
jgi:hypothetical protein